VNMRAQVVLQRHMVNAYMYGQDTEDPDRAAKAWNEVDDLLKSLGDPYTHRVSARCESNVMCCELPGECHLPSATSPPGARCSCPAAVRAPHAHQYV